MDIEVRPATLADAADVERIAAETWTDRGGDYLGRVFADWVAADGGTQRTFVADADGTAVGVVRAVMVSDHEAWMQGMRVAPAVRGRGVSGRLHEAAADWARERGAAVARAMVFSWNGPALAASRAAGFEPATEFRWIHPAPDPAAEPELPVTSDAAAAWTYWQRSAARDHLRGLALAPAESWALQELTQAALARAADGARLATVVAGGTRGFVHRVRVDERELEDGGTERRAEYGVGAWADGDAAEALLAAVARDAASVDADRARVLVPETVAAVSDAAAAGVEIGEEPVFVLAADLTGSG
ncbi:MAG: N-acetyltransferase family protein [Halobacteriales archaeon]